MTTQIVRAVICLAVSVLVLPSNVQASPILLTVQSAIWTFDGAARENAAVSGLGGVGFRGDWGAAISRMSRGGSGGGVSSSSSAGFGSLQSGPVATQSGSVETFLGGQGLGRDLAFPEQALGSFQSNESIDDYFIDRAPTSSMIANGVVRALSVESSTASIESSTARVPEPGTALLLAAGALALWQKYPKLRQRRGSTKQP
jgi:hypothetical protein